MKPVTEMSHDESGKGEVRRTIVFARVYLRCERSQSKLISVSKETIAVLLDSLAVNLQRNTRELS